MKKISLVLFITLLLVSISFGAVVANCSTLSPEGGKDFGSVSMGQGSVTVGSIPVPTQDAQPEPTVDPVPTLPVPEPTPDTESDCGSWSEDGPHPCPGGTNGGSEHKGPGFPDPTP